MASVNEIDSLNTMQLLADVELVIEVITQSPTFMSTENAFKYVNRIPVLVDEEKSILRMYSEKLIS